MRRLLAAVLLGLLAARAAAVLTINAQVDIDVDFQGVAGIKDLKAQPGAAQGEIRLTWTEPERAGTTGPYSYDLRVSSAANISDNAGLLAAKTLAQFSPTALPAPGAGGGQVTLVLTGLQPGVVHYFALREKDALTAAGVWSRTSGWNQQNSAPARAITISTHVPMEPLGVVVTPAANTVQLSWTAVTKLDDGTAFVDPAAPTTDELIGYTVYRSTAVCGTTNYALAATLPQNTRTYTDTTLGLPYNYKVYAYNAVGLSSSAATISYLGERNYFSDDCVSRVTVDADMAPMLNAATNGLGYDVRLAGVRRPEDVGNSVFQSIKFAAYKNGVDEIPLTLPRPVKIRIHYDVVGGVPVPDTAAVAGVQSVLAPRSSPAAFDVANLGAYWDNGAEFKKVYGEVDAANQTVNVDSPNLGTYQIRALFRADGAVFDLSNLSGRVITPNGDGRNDRIIFTYDPGPAHAAVSGRVYDVNGMFVAGMSTDPLLPNALIWDGKANGKAVTSGVYVYRIQGDGKTFTGTVVVAR